ncbi:hypothetical protein ThidrDRAFT_3589, partial [Thiorhodococcus drewsii AZ1]
EPMPEGQEFIDIDMQDTGKLGQVIEFGRTLNFDADTDPISPDQYD